MGEFPQIRLGSIDEEGGEALEVMIRGSDGDGETGEAGHQPTHVLCVGTKLTQQLDAVIKSSLGHDSQRCAQVFLIPIWISSGF